MEIHYINLYTFLQHIEYPAIVLLYHPERLIPLGESHSYHPERLVSVGENYWYHPERLIPVGESLVSSGEIGIGPNPFLSSEFQFIDFKIDGDTPHLYRGERG